MKKNNTLITRDFENLLKEVNGGTFKKKKKKRFIYAF